MKRTRPTTHPSPFAQGLLITGIALVVLLALPLFGAVAFVARFALFAALVVGLVGATVAYAVSPRFRAWIDPEPFLSLGGFRLAPDVAVHPGHSWVRFQRGEATVGADDFSLSLLGPVERAELPSLGDRCVQGQPMLHLFHGNRRLVIRAPMSGEIVEQNVELEGRPDLPNQEPYADGWLVRIRPESPARERRALLRGSEARKWFRGEIDRLLARLLPSPATGPSLPDGGQIVHDLHRLVDDQSWERLHAELFG